MLKGLGTRFSFSLLVQGWMRISFPPSFLLYCILKTTVTMDEGFTQAEGALLYALLLDRQSDDFAEMELCS